MRILLSDTDIFTRILEENANSRNNHYLRSITTNLTKKTNIFFSSLQSMTVSHFKYTY